MSEQDYRYDDLRALIINCTLKRSPERSHTQGLIDRSLSIMTKHGVAVETLRAVDHDIATGVWPDMTEHGWPADHWPGIYQRVLAADILVLAGPIWLGDNSSVRPGRFPGRHWPPGMSRRRTTCWPVPAVSPSGPGPPLTPNPGGTPRRKAW